MSSIPLSSGHHHKDGSGRGHFHKSHTLGRSDVHQEPRAFNPVSSFTGTGTLAHVGASVIAGARSVSASSAATSYASTGRLAPEQPEVERQFMDSARRQAEDRYAHLRRAPVARDFANTAEPSAHLPVLGPSRLPSWVEFDRKVLRFSAYFQEAVHGAAGETWRVRPVFIHFHLEDDTMAIVEPGVPNGGTVSGALVRRHRVPRDQQGNMFGVDDLWIGAELPVYGRRYRLTGADAFTRAFYLQNGAPLEADEQTPQDPFARKHAASRPASFNKLRNPLSIHQEAALGKQQHSGIAATQQFLRNDGKVLRFYSVHEDTSLYGEKRPYVVHFFLADDTVEVLEVAQPNSGRGAFPALLKRSRLPRDHTSIKRDVAHVGASTGSAGGVEGDARLLYITERDLRVGQSLNVYGRELQLCGADEFTQRWYAKNYGLSAADFAPVGMADPPEEAQRIAAPPPTGFGTDEDSLGSFLYLVPRAPKSDQKKLHELDGVLLRFSAKFAAPAWVDRDRQFIITYYLANDTLQIFESFQRNAGFVAGKWADRQRYKNVATGEWFHARDLHVGAVIEVSKTKFALLDADEYTKKFMDANPSIWNEQSGNVNQTEKAIALNGGVPFTSRANAPNTGGRPF